MKPLMRVSIAMVLAAGFALADLKEYTAKIPYSRADWDNVNMVMTAPAPGGVYILAQPKGIGPWTLLSHIAGERRELAKLAIPGWSLVLLNSAHVAWTVLEGETFRLHRYDIETGKTTDQMTTIRGLVALELQGDSAFAIEKHMAEMHIAQYDLDTGQELWRERLPQPSTYKLIPLPQGLLVLDVSVGAWRMLNMATRTWVGGWTGISSILRGDLVGSHSYTSLSGNFRVVILQAFAGLRGDNLLFVMARLGHPKGYGLLELDPQGREVSREILKYPQDRQKFGGPNFWNTIQTSDGVLVVGRDGRIVLYDGLRP